jgi:hypothetical protein
MSLRRTAAITSGFFLAMWLRVGCDAWAAENVFVLKSAAPISAAEEPAMSRWSHEGLVTLYVGNPVVKTFTVRGRDGSELSRTNFSIPNTSRLWVHGYDRDLSGNLVFCGEAYSSDGKLAPFIGVQSPQTGDVQLIRTYPYWPTLLAVAPDGTIWTIGGERTPDGKPDGTDVNPNGDVVRHFDRSGKLIASAFPRKEVIPGARGHTAF